MKVFTILALCTLAKLAASSPIIYYCRDNHGSCSDYRFEIKHDVIKQKNGGHTVNKHYKNVNKNYSVKSENIKCSINEYKERQKEKKEEKVYDIFDFFKFYPEIKFGNSNDSDDGFMDNTDPRNDRGEWKTDEPNNSDNSNKEKSNKDVTESYDNEGESKQETSHDTHVKSKSYSSELVDFFEDVKDEIKEEDHESNQEGKITLNDDSKPEHEENSEGKEYENKAEQNKESSNSEIEEHISF